MFSDLYRCVHKKDAKGALEILNRCLEQGRELMQFITDYIGYLRNVMLLKASEETAKELDVSADHLQRMLEDARASELNEIVRYINVFSGLTEQIRYSANRRVLAEAAVIRLCEPSMDVSRDLQTKVLTLEERIRSLEDLLASRAEFAAAPSQDRSGRNAAPQAGAGTPGSTEKAGTEEPPAEEAGRSPARVRLPAAIPEELRALAQKWDQLIASIPPEEHFMKICLQKAHPTLTEDGNLLVVFEGFLEADYFMGKESAENAKFFADFLAARTGRQVPVRYKFLDKGRKFSDNYEDLRNAVNTAAIHMEIEEDDE